MVTLGKLGLLSIVKHEGKLNVGDRLLKPLILPSTSDKTIDLTELASQKNIVVFVYPGDKEGLRYGELAGCTPQACSFRSAIKEFHALNTEVFGLSLQRIERQQLFKEREHLNFELLSDSEAIFINLFGIDRWATIDNTQNTKAEIFPRRTTVMVKKGGLINMIMPADDIENHVETMLNILNQ